MAKMRERYIDSFQGFRFECIFTHTPLHKSQLDLQNSTELKQAWKQRRELLDWDKKKSVQQDVTDYLEIGPECSIDTKSKK